MKKIALFALIIASCSALEALPLGNPADARLLTDSVFFEGWDTDPGACYYFCNAWSVRVGFYGDYVFNRNLEVDTATNESDIDNTQLYTNAGYLAVNFWNRFDLFTTLGATNFYIRTPGSSFGNTLTNEFLEIETDSGFSWSLGARWSLFQCKCMGIGLEGQYFSVSPRLNFVKNESEDPQYINGQNLHYHEWQLGAGIYVAIPISGCSSLLVPYAGVKYARASVDMNELRIEVIPAPSTFVTLFDLKSGKHYGYAVGITIVGCSKVSFGVEGRFADEKAVYVNGQIRL